MGSSQRPDDRPRPGPPRAVRAPALAGRSYSNHSTTLRAQIDRFYGHSDGSGAPRLRRDPGTVRLRGVISPHIDFYRGGPVYTWAYREIVESSDADVFVVLGVAHQSCANRFALTRSDFDTPLGLVRTDADYVDRLAATAGTHLFDDEPAHRVEHSIEFQAVFLQHVLGGVRDFRIVPVLVGSFGDLLRAGVDPIEDAEVRRFVGALRSVEASSGKKVAYIGGIDLCHVGPEFGDAEPVLDGTLQRVRAFDESMLGRAAAVDPSGWFGMAADVLDRWRVCGLAATYVLLHAIGPARGRVLKYAQAVDPRRTCCVSFASLAFHEGGVDPERSRGRHG